jgi:ABC-type oligopeptide transport system substrate-binding subunit
MTRPENCPDCGMVNQVEVRCAIALMMNRSLLNERVLPGQAEPIYSLIPTSFSADEPTFTIFLTFMKRKT